MEGIDEAFQEHKNLIKWTCEKYRKSGFDLDDLFQVAAIGFTKAFQRFDESYGLKFSTYCVPLMEGELKRYLRDWNIGAKASRDVKTLATRVYFIKHKADSEIAKELYVPKEKVEEARLYLSRRVPASTSQKINEGGGDKEMTVGDLIGSKDDTSLVLVKDFLETLTGKEKVVCEGLLNGQTQRELGALLGISQVQVSRILKKIRPKLEEYMNIERMFQEEIREKKRAANGVHSRTGSRGYVGKMLFPVDVMDTKKKREYKKNGKVLSYNMNDILSYKEFAALPADQQKRMLKHWRVRYNNALIMKTMGIESNKFYQLLNNLNIEKKPTASSLKKRYTPEVIEEFKRNGITYTTLRDMEADQQAEVLEHLDQQFSTAELTEYLGVKPHTVYQMRSNAKKLKKEVVEVEKPVVEKEKTVIQSLVAANNSSKSMQPHCTVFMTQLKGEFQAEQLAKKLRKLAEFLEGEETYFINLTICEMQGG